MTNPTRKTLIDQITRRAYENATQWLGTDPTIGSQLRDGLRTALSAYDKIDKEITDRAALLTQLEIKTRETLAYYSKLPGDAGTWECSALQMVLADIQALQQTT